MLDNTFSPEQVLMDANIREFGQAISLICALEMGGKITPEEAYTLIRKTWRELQQSRRLLRGASQNESEDDI